MYVASVAGDHYAQVLTALRAGVAVLCEKPLAPTLGEVQHLVAEAQHRRVLLVEGMWSRYLPAGRMVADLHAQPEIAETPLRNELGVGFSRTAAMQET